MKNPKTTKSSELGSVGNVQDIFNTSQWNEGFILVLGVQLGVEGAGSGTLIWMAALGSQCIKQK